MLIAEGQWLSVVHLPQDRFCGQRAGVQRGLETLVADPTARKGKPFHRGMVSGLEKERIDEIADLTRRLISAVGEDIKRPGLQETPERVARSYMFLTEGYEQNLNAIVNGAIFEEKCDEMVLVKNIHFFSLCEHHILPFWGVCHVGYLPAGKIIGISKIPRIIDMFSRRLQLQERMTYQIADALNSVLQTRGVGVVTEAYHLCMMMRGVQKQESRTLASAMLGGFRTREQTRLEFLSLIGHNKQI